MAIIKTDVTGQYFVVGMDVARDQRLGLTERGMLLTLLSLPPDWDFSIEGMVSILPDGKSRVRNAFNSLQDLGYVKRNQVRKEDGSYGKGLIEVYHKPIILPMKSDLPVVDNPQSENPTTDSKPQVNKQISNNHKSIIDKGVGTLPQEDYERLCSLHDKAVVDYQIERIKTNHYIGYMNFDRIDLMCREYESRKAVAPPKKKDAFHNFEERKHPPGYFEDLELKLLFKERM